MLKYIATAAAPWLMRQGHCRNSGENPMEFEGMPGPELVCGTHYRALSGCPSDMG